MGVKKCGQRNARKQLYAYKPITTVESQGWKSGLFHLPLKSQEPPPYTIKKKKKIHQRRFDSLVTRVYQDFRYYIIETKSRTASKFS